MVVIALDLGNFKSFPCFIADFDESTRLGGEVHDLLPPRLPDGIPSVYFYSKEIGELCGELAVRSVATPLENRLRYLKRHLGETVTIEDRKIAYDDAITAVVQHCIRSANRQLHVGWQLSTNLVSLSYPATYLGSQREHLIRLVERATLEDGTHLKVIGTIAEPAAAALDYLAEHAKTDRETVVLTYDLGGGTFDLALVAAYPKGRKNAAGEVRYYEVIDTDGIPNLGGVDFDKVLCERFHAAIGEPLSEDREEALRELAETTKVELSSYDRSLPTFEVGGRYVRLPVTREEFEKGSRELLEKTVEKTRRFLEKHPNQKPDFILLSGGGSEMPMVSRALSEALPDYRILSHNPSRAIAYGAARYGTTEINDDPVLTQHIKYDIGVRFYEDPDDEDGYIETYLPAGTELPFDGEYHHSHTLGQQRYSAFTVFEACVDQPDAHRVRRDYREIMEVILDHERAVPPGTKNKSRIQIDRTGRLTIEARMLDKPEKAPAVQSVVLKNLS